MFDVCLPVARGKGVILLLSFWRHVDLWGDGHGYRYVSLIIYHIRSILRILMSAWPILMVVLLFVLYHLFSWIEIDIWIRPVPSMVVTSIPIYLLLQVIRLSIFLESNSFAVGAAAWLPLMLVFNCCLVRKENPCGSLRLLLSHRVLILVRGTLLPTLTLVVVPLVIDNVLKMTTLTISIIWLFLVSIGSLILLFAVHLSNSPIWTIVFLIYSPPLVLLWLWFLLGLNAVFCNNLLL